MIIDIAVSKRIMKELPQNIHNSASNEKKSADYLMWVYNFLAWFSLDWKYDKKLKWYFYNYPVSEQVELEYYDQLKILRRMRRISLWLYPVIPFYYFGMMFLLATIQ
jgi:uncharacterized membrane protein